MPSAVDFFPCHIIELMNFVTRSDPYTGSASTVRFGVCPFLGMLFSSQLSFAVLHWQLATDHWQLVLCFLLAFGAVLRASLVTARDAGRVKRSAYHVITHAGQILYTAPADQHNRVLLQVMANTRDIRRHFDSIRQPNARYFTQRRVRLLRRLGIHARAHSALLRTRLQSRTRRLIPGPLAAKFHQLIKRRHSRHSWTRQAASLPHISLSHTSVETGLAPSPVYHTFP